MGLMQAVYYRGRDGSQPVHDFVRSLQPLAAVVVIENQIDRLNLCTENGPPLPFPKTTEAISHGEIEIANERWNDFVARMGARPRIPPRAAGYDAPRPRGKRWLARWCRLPKVVICRPCLVAQLEPLSLMTSAATRRRIPNIGRFALASRALRRSLACSSSSGCSTT